MMMEQMIEENPRSLIEEKKFSKNKSVKYYKEIMVGTINRLKQLEISNTIPQTFNGSDPNNDKQQGKTHHREFIQTFSFQNSIYVAYVNGSFIRITRQRFVKGYADHDQSDYQEFVYSLNENICNQVFFMGVENANHDTQLDNSVIIIIPLANGLIHIKQLVKKDALKQELTIESHGQIIYSIGLVYSNSLKQRVELCACLANQKVFCYEIDVGSLNDPHLNFVRHTSEIKLFDNFINQFYHQKLKQNQDQLLTCIVPVSRFILLAITKDFRLKVINFKQKQVKLEYPLLTDRDTISLLDPFKNVKINTLINNPLKLNTVNGLQNAVNVLISVSFVNNSIVNYIQFFNLEIIPQEELGQLPIVPDQSLLGRNGMDENFAEQSHPLFYCTNVKIGELTEIYSYHNKQDIVDVNLTSKGVYIASTPSNQSPSLQFLSYDNIMNVSTCLSLPTVYSADFNIKNLLQQDLLYLENDDSNMAYREHPLNRLFRPDRFPLKLIHEFYNRYSEFRLSDDYLGSNDIKKITDQLSMQSEMKFEVVVKNSLVSLTNNWILKYPILAIHTDAKNTEMLPVVIRENGLFNLVPMNFYEALNFKLNEFISEYSSSQKNQSTFRDYNSKNIPQNKYSQDFSNTSIYLKYQNWCEQQTTAEDIENYLSEIFELLSWTKLFLMSDIQNCLNQCPYEMSFIQCIQQGIQSASNTLSYESLSDQFESILSDEDQKNKVIASMKLLLDEILVELFHENLNGSQPEVGNQAPLLINIDFCVWSKNLAYGSIRYKIRELVELAMVILSFFKYIEYRKVSEEDMSYLENTQQIVGIAYSITFLFDKPLLQIDKMNKLAIKYQEQSLDHNLFMDVLSYFIQSELSQEPELAKYDNLNKCKTWLKYNVKKVEDSLFLNLGLQITNNQLPNILTFLKNNHQFDVSLCISQFFKQTPAILYSQTQCLYQTGQHKKVMLLLHKIIQQIHVNPTIINDGPWTNEKKILAVHHELKDKLVKEDIKFIRYCLMFFFKDSTEDLKCKYELAQTGLLLFFKGEEQRLDRREQSTQIKYRNECKLEFLKTCFQYCLQNSLYHEAFNYIKQMNEINKKYDMDFNVLSDCISKFVHNICKNELIGITSQLVYEDDLAEKIENEINSKNRLLMNQITENYSQNESEKYIYLDKEFSQENLYKFNSSMNFYISVKNYKQAGISQWKLYQTYNFMEKTNEVDDPMPKQTYKMLLELQILALTQAKSLFEMAGYEKHNHIYENNKYEEKEQFSFIEDSTKNGANQRYHYTSIDVIQSLIVELESKLVIQQCIQNDIAEKNLDQPVIVSQLIQHKKYDQLITYMHQFKLDFSDILMYFTELYYRSDEEDNHDDEDIDYFQLIRRILILNQNENYMQYSVLVLKTYGSCISDKPRHAGETVRVGDMMRGLANKLKLPKMNNFLFVALSDFGEDRVLAEEIAEMAQTESQNVNLLQVNKSVKNKQYIPLQLISKVLENERASEKHKQVLLQVSELFNVQ